MALLITALRLPSIPHLLSPAGKLEILDSGPAPAPCPFRNILTVKITHTCFLPFESSFPQALLRSSAAFPQLRMIVALSLSRPGVLIMSFQMSLLAGQKARTRTVDL